MAESSEKLIDFKELKNHFAHGRVYNQDGKDWPRKTIMFARAEEQGNTVCSWKKYVNEPKTRKTPKPRHAEILFLNDIPLSKEKNYILDLHLILSYSPCCSCVDAIIKYKKNAPYHVNIKIQFSNFYKCNKIKFLIYIEKVFLFIYLTGLTTRTCFFDILNVQGPQKSEYLRETSNSGRIEREKVDREILKTIVLYAQLRNPLYITRMEKESFKHIGKSSEGTEARKYYDIAFSISQAEVASVTQGLDSLNIADDNSNHSDSDSDTDAEADESDGNDEDSEHQTQTSEIGDEQQSTPGPMQNDTCVVFDKPENISGQ